MNQFNTYVFHSNEQLSTECVEAGAKGIVIDWEKSGKRHRQSLFNTQISLHGEKELELVANALNTSIICRVNGGDHINKDEIIKAIDLGATEIMIPMIKSKMHIEKALKFIDGKASVITMIETQEAIDIVDVFSKYSINKVYVGLNDLAISRNSRNIFLPIVDGTLEKIRDNLTMELGFAGLTHPSLGSPLSCLLLIKEMKRLNCTFSFLRRSFYKDVERYSTNEIINAINNAYQFTRFDEETHVEDLKKEILNLPDTLI